MSLDKESVQKALGQVRYPGYSRDIVSFGLGGGSIVRQAGDGITVGPDSVGYELTTRGYYYELETPVPVNVLEGRVMGEVKKPIAAYMRKPGVDYSELPASGDSQATEPMSAPMKYCCRMSVPPSRSPLISVRPTLVPPA